MTRLLIIGGGPGGPAAATRLLRQKGFDARNVSGGFRIIGLK